MKACRKQNSSDRQAQASGLAGARASAGPRPPAAAAAPVHRYVHPIRTAPPARRTAEELFTDIQETLARQERALEELLRRTEGQDT